MKLSFQISNLNMSLSSGQKMLKNKSFSLLWYSLKVYLKGKQCGFTKFIRRGRLPDLCLTERPLLPERPVAQISSYFWSDNYNIGSVHTRKRADVLTISFEKRASLARYSLTRFETTAMELRAFSSSPPLSLKTPATSKTHFFQIYVQSENRLYFNNKK